ncbi:MAG TPA: 16S rRNA (uracil(1498)-N(3))-methyltransferase [Marinobacterium sp.]|nr:16S rRNA (uracil(1498)-N(3))-methyltransferase [Marinobacterium sp.]
MRIPRAYVEAKLNVGAQFALPDEVHNHLIKVLRMKTDQPLVLFNGDGNDYMARLTEVEKRHSAAMIESAQERTNESPLRIEIGQGLSRGERMDFAIQKATELGVSQITPLFTERSEVRLNAERQAKRTKHWQQVSISACEQSYRATLPSIAEPILLSDWLRSCHAELKLVLSPHTEPLVLGELSRPNSVALLIGPEGGLEEAEVTLAIEHGFHPWLLGPRVLRTETAPVAAAAVLHYLWGDFS